MTSAIVAGLDRGSAHAMAELSEVASALEAVFLKAGGGLAEAIGCWRGISSSFAGLAGQFDREDMLRCIDDLGQALAVAAALGGAGSGKALAQLARLSDGLSAMRARLERLSRTVAEVKLVALNAKVEAAHLDEGSTDFSVFTREIDRLAMDATGELSVLDAELRALAADTVDAHRSQSAFDDGHGAELLMVTRRLEEGLRTLASQRRQVSEAAMSIGERSRLAGDRVAQAVVALQIGDITRQRTEHVAEALGLLAGLAANPQNSAAEDERQATALISTLQSKQLDQAAGDLETEVGRVSASLTALAQETEAIARLGKDSFGGDGESSFLEGLGGEVARVQTLLEGYSAALTRTEAIMAAVARATAAMMAHVEAIHSIEADLKIMALNASFKCSRLGDRGRTLSVVAQSLRQLASRTVEDAGVLLSGLRDAMDTAETLAHGRGCGDGGSIVTAVANLGEAAALLAATGTEQSAALTVLGTDSQRAQTLLRAATGDIAVSAEFSRRLRRVAATLAVAGEGVALDPNRIEQIKDMVLSRLAGNYTMASERALHDLFGGGGDQSAVDEGPVDVDDLLF